MNKTGISWTDATWNPVRGCSRVSSGCQRCYAEQQAARVVRMGNGKPTAYDGLVRMVRGEARWTGEVRFVYERLADPLKLRKPRRIFVNSMSDLFHEKLTNEQIAAVFGVMAACPRHTFQVLTKRAGRMREWFAWLKNQADSDRHLYAGSPESMRCLVEASATRWCLTETGERLPSVYKAATWPLSNVHLGVSIENQTAADERIPDLLSTPAAVRWISAEPLLGPIELQHMRGWLATFGDEHHMLRGVGFSRIDWVVAGCESGPAARLCDVEWLRSLRNQCAATDVPFWLKQAVDGRHRPRPIMITRADMDKRTAIAVGPGSGLKPGGVIELPYLDGIQHSAMPKVAP